MSANQEQSEFWNGQRGQCWVTEQEVMDRALAPFGAAVLAAAAVVSGERVIDVGCGCGATTLELAQAVGPSGTVLGIDISEPMLARARERARGLPNVTLMREDAAVHAFAQGSADLIFSRFGVMFFDEPTSAMRNLGAALMPGDRLAFICWRSLEDNPWLAVPVAAVKRVLPAGPPPSPYAPGPLAFADAARVRGILEQAGFAEVSHKPFDHGMPLGDNKGLDAAVEHAMTVGPSARLLANVDAEAREMARVAVREALAPHLVGDDVTLGGGAWLVTARRTA